VVKFDYLQKKLMVVPGVQNVKLTNFENQATFIFGDFNGDGLTDFMTPQKVYKIEGSTAAKELKKINTETLLWWQYTSTGTGFIKTQKDYTQQKLAYIAPTQRNVVKKSSIWDRVWSGSPGTYQYTEYGGSHIIATDFDNDGKTNLISVRKFGKAKDDDTKKFYLTTLGNLNDIVYLDNTVTHTTKLIDIENSNNIFFNRTSNLPI